MNQDKATEEFFRLRGIQYQEWYDEPYDYVGYFKDKKFMFHSPPKICESMTDWIKYVAEFMETYGLALEVDTGKYCKEVSWYIVEGHEDEVVSRATIIDHQILYASVLAAILYLKEKKNEKC
jgi:hypothetical protein